VAAFIQSLCVQFKYEAPTASGFYYWTTNYYWQSESVSVADGPGLNATLDLARMVSLDSTTDVLWRAQTISGPGSSTQWGGFGFTGDLPDTDDVHSFINCARIEGKCEDGSRWYKMLRFPLRPEDVEGSMLSADTYDYLNDVYIPALPLDILCNIGGHLVTSARVIPEIQMWQYRHGTKRRSRPVLVFS